MIVFKLVDKETRFGSNAGMYITHSGLHNFEELLRRIPNLVEYFPNYFFDKVVHAVEGSVGILCFWTYEDAADFARCNIRNTRRFEIIRVEGIGYPSDTGRLANNCGDNPRGLLDNYARLGYVCSMGLPKGTVCFKSVRVLE